MIVRIDCLTKDYGSNRVLNNITLEINKGMFGLLGPNGAGKTTLVRILSTLMKKSCGSITVDGIDIEKTKEVRRLIGYLPQEFSFYPSLTVFEAMDYLALLSGVNLRGARKKLILELLERVCLEECLKLNVRVLPECMKRRLGIAQALLNNPGLLIVDEPTAGLDPEECIHIRNLLMELAQSRTVILSTNSAGDIENTCKNLAVLNNGTLLYSGTVNDLLMKSEGGTIEGACGKLIKEVI